MPDRPELLEACWGAAIAKVRARTGLGSSPLFIGGKSMGGRFATRIAGAKEGLVLNGVVCVGYPLHPSGKPEVRREEILDDRGAAPRRCRAQKVTSLEARGRGEALPRQASERACLRARGRRPHAEREVSGRGPLLPASQKFVQRKRADG